MLFDEEADLLYAACYLRRFNTPTGRKPCLKANPRSVPGLAGFPGNNAVGRC